MGMTNIANLDSLCNHHCLGVGSLFFPCVRRKYTVTVVESQVSNKILFLKFGLDFKLQTIIY